MEILYNGVGAAIPEKSPCTFNASNLWNGEAGRDNLWIESKATLCPKALCAWRARKQIL